MESVSGNGRQASVLVVGGGIGGMRSALDLADAGLHVYLVEKSPCLGGRVAQLGFMFPQHDCVLCRGTPDHGYGCTRPSISPAYIQHNQHPNITILTNTQVTAVEGQAGNFSVTLRQEPRYVDVSRCINCGYCADVCPVEIADEYQQGMTVRKAAYKTAARAAPDAFVIERGPYCDDCGKCVEVCPTHAIDLLEQPKLHSMNVGAIILALGFQTYDPSPLEELGYGRYPNVVQAMEYERLASRSGPTEGVVVRPSDRSQPNSIAWLQCVGSRGPEAEYCSSICCMYATKEAILAKERLGKDINCRIFIMDERAFNKEYSNYFNRAREDHHIQYTYCRVSQVREDPHTRNLILRYADPNGKIHQEEFEMVVLATGLRPPQGSGILAQTLNIELNEFGYCQTDKFYPLQTSRPGIFVCGAFSTPKEVVETILDASGASAEVMRLLNDRLGAYPFQREFPFLTTAEMPPERDVSGETARAGVFACSCAKTQSEILDLGSLAEEANHWPGVVHSEVVDTACFPETLGDIQKTIKAKGLNRVVIAACSNRTHDSLFQRTVREIGLNPYLLELVNLREQCARVHQSQPERASRKARELTRIAVARAIAAKEVHKQTHRLRSSALIIGGGVAGMTAALAVADSGYTAHLIERGPMLGGNLLNLYYDARGSNPQRLLRDLVNRVRSHNRIEVYTYTEVTSHTGHVGFFRSELTTRLPDGEVHTTNLEHGVVIVATGGMEDKNHPLLSMRGVMTQRELEEVVIHQPQTIAALEDVVMIQCARKEGTAEYCSRVCCTNALKNAIRIKLFNPKCNVTMLYKNIVTYGFRETHYEEARRLGVRFLRYTDDNPPKVSQRSGKLLVQVRDLSLDREMRLPADIVPLSTSVVPSEGTAKLADMLNLPLSSEGFFQEAQMKLRPMDFERPGIFLAGMAHYPKFTEESISHALAAAARALPLMSSVSLYLGGVVAEVDPDKCVGCLTCTRTCPFGIPKVIQEEGRNGVGKIGGAAYIDPALCEGCGTCTGECPANAIQLVHYRDEQIMLREQRGLGAWLVGEPV